MAIDAPPPAQQQENPYLPPGPKPLVFEQWEGLNTQTTRPGVPDKQAYWLDGFMPLAARNLRTLYGIGPVLYTASGTTVVCFFFANISTTPYMVVLLANGQVVAVNTSNGSATTILVAATITAPSITSFGVSQWGNEFILIVADQINGYWVWNGSAVFTAGAISPEIVMTNNGGGYSTLVVASIVGGHGSGASLVPTVENGQVISVSVVSGGSGYLATDVVKVAFAPAPTGGSGASLVPSAWGTTAVGPSTQFTLSSISIVAGGSLYNTPTLTFTGGVDGALYPTALAIVASGTIVNTSITNRGLVSSTAGISIVIIDAGVVASASVNLMPFGIQGDCIETYSGHVWIGDDATIYFSAPGSFTDFSTNNGGGNFTSTDSFLQFRFSRLVQSNGFLYLVGDSSVNYISGVQTSGTSPTTTFTNQNADPQVGSPYPASVRVFGRNVMLANSIGIYVISGGAAQKASDMLDGVWNTVATAANGFDFGIQLSSAVANIFGRKVWMTLTRIVDPATGTTENKLCMWDGKQWWASLQNLALTFINSQENNSVLTAYGTNGTVIHPLFQTATNTFTKRAVTRLFDAPGGIQFDKAATNLWAAAQWYSTLSGSMIVSVDNEYATQGASYTLTGPSSIGISLVAPQAVGQHGRYTGLTISTTAGDMAIIEFMMQDQIVSYLGR